tara:strand:+ start:1327 stop:1863 length:537 start_codon:yes stop_codon:yes gene_type:complete
MAQAKRKKRFFDVEIPIINKETNLLAYEKEDLKGRLIKYDLTRFLKGKSMIFTLVVDVEKDKIVAKPKEMKLMPYFLRRMIRRGTNYVEDSFQIECKDAVLKIKPFLITRRKVSRAVRKTLRENAKKELTSYAKEKTSDVLFEEIIKGLMQKPLNMKLKKIYPLSLFEIRVLKVEKKK